MNLLKRNNIYLHVLQNTFYIILILSSFEFKVLCSTLDHFMDLVDVVFNIWRQRSLIYLNPFCYRKNGWNIVEFVNRIIGLTHDIIQRISGAIIEFPLSSVQNHTSNTATHIKPTMINTLKDTWTHVRIRICEEGVYISHCGNGEEGEKNKRKCIGNPRIAIRASSKAAVAATS